MTNQRCLWVLAATVLVVAAVDANRAEELPPGAIVRLGGSAFDAPGGLRSVAWSPDGRFLAACGNFFGVLVWDAHSGELVQKLETSGNQVGEVFFTADSRQLVAGMRSWNIADWQATDLTPPGTNQQLREVALARVQGRSAAVLFEHPGASVHAVEDNRELLKVVIGEYNMARALSPDDRLLAVAGADRQRKRGHVEVWNVKEKKKRYELAVPGTVCYWLQFTPDGKTLAAHFYPEDRIRQYDMETGQEGPAAEIASPRSRMMSSDGRLLAVSDAESNTYLFERATGKRLGQLPTFPKAFSPDGKRFITFRGGLVEVFDVASGKRVFPEDKPLLLAGRRFCESPDGKRLATFELIPRRLAIWDPVSQKPLQQWTLPVVPGRLQFSPQGDFIAMGGEVITLLPTNDTEAAPLVFPPERAPTTTYLATTSADATAFAEVEASGLIRVRSLAASPDRPRQPTLALAGHLGRPTAIDFSRDGSRLVSCAPDKTIRVWALDSGKQVLKISLERNAEPCVALSPDASRVAAVVGDRVRVWNTADGKLATVMLLDNETARRLEASPDGKRLVCGCQSGRLHIFNLENGKLVELLADGKRAVSVLRYAPDGKTLCVGRSGGGVEFWNAADLKRTAELSDLPNEIRSFAFHRESGRVAAGDARGGVAVWELATGKRRNLFTGNGGPLHILAFTHDGNRLVCRDQTTFSPLDLVNNRLAGGRYSVSRSGEKQALDFAFSPDGKTLATAGPGAVQLWEIESGRCTATLVTPTDCSATLMFSPTGETLTAARQGVTIWRLGDGSPPIHIDKRAAGETLSLAYTPDGRVLATGGRERAIKLWDVASGSLLHTLSLRREIHNRRLAFSADGRILFGYDRDFNQPPGRQTYLMMWETATGGLLAERNVPIEEHEVSADRRRLISVADHASYLVWDLAKWQDETMTPQPDDPTALEALWGRLADEDPRTAYRAIGAMAAHPAEAIALIKSRLKPAAGREQVGRKEIEALVAQLSSDDLAARREASTRLRELGTSVHDELRRILKADENLPSAARNRIEILLAAQVSKRPRDTLRAIRAVAVLERIQTPEAGAVLAALAGGAEDAERTRQAQAALSRLRAAEHGP